MARLDRHYVRPAEKRDEEGRPFPKVRYQTCITQQPVYVYTKSVLASGSAQSMDTAPEYVIYHELVHTTRDYVTGLTISKSSWLAQAAKSMVAFGEPREDPAPRYNAKMDRILAFATPSFGPYQWQLSPVEIPLTTGKVYLIFVRAFLRGEIVPSFGNLQVHLNANPDSLLNHTATRNLSKISALVGPLSSLKVQSRKDFENNLEKIKAQRFLAGLLLWYHVESHVHVIKAWNEFCEKYKSSKN